MDIEVDEAFLYEITVAKELMEESDRFWYKKVAKTLSKVEKYFQKVLEKEEGEF